MATALAELVGAAIGLNMLFGLPLRAGAALTAALVAVMLLTNSYRKVERWIIAMAGLVGLAFVYELTLVHVDWARLPGLPDPGRAGGLRRPDHGVFGAVVMPHNLFLHSEIIQSRQYNREDDAAVRERLRYEFFDTLAAMVWAGPSTAP